MKENRGAVLSAEIGVKRHLHDLGMAGFIRTNILISRVFRVPAAVAHSRIHHSGHGLERGLDPLETSCTKRCTLCHRPLPCALRFSKANMQSKTLCAAPAAPDLLAFPAPTPCTDY